MSQPLRFLILEDNLGDLKLVLDELDKGYFKYVHKHCIDKSSFENALIDFIPDLIISNYNHPELSCIDALILSRSYYKEIPFIVVSGSLTQEEAVKLIIDYDVNEYILKANLGRLNTSISRVVKENEVRKKLRIKEEELELLSFVSKQTHNGVIITDPDGRVEWVNDACISITGFTLDECMGQKPGDLFQGIRTNPETVRRISKNLKLNIPFQEEILNYRKDGTEYWVKLDISPVFNSDEDLIKFVAIQEDITDKKNSSRKLLESDALLKSLTNNIPGAILRYTLDSQGNDNIEYISDGCYDIYEVTAADILKDNSRLWSLIVPEDVVAMLPTIQKSAQELSTWDFIFRVRTASGKLKWVQASGSPKKNNKTGTVTWNTVILDITKEKEFENELTKSNNELLKAQSVGSMGNWSFDIETKKIIWSNEIFNIYDRDPKLGAPNFEEFLTYHDESDEGLHNALIAIELGQPYDVDVKLITKKGDRKFTRSIGEPVKDLDGKVIKYTGVSQDITYRKQIEFELIESETKLKAITNNLESVVQRFVLFEDGSTKITFISNKVEDLTGLTTEQILEDSSLLWSQIPEEDIPGVQESIEKSATEMSLWDHKWRIKDKNGILKYLRGKGMPRKDPGSNNIIWDSVILNITKEIEWEQSIKKTNERLIEAQEIAQIGDWSFDLNKEKLYLSPIVKKIHEIDEDLDVNAGVNFYKEGYDRDRINDVFQKAIEKGIPYTEELIIVTTKGNERWVRTDGRAEIKDGKTVRVHGTFMDITDQKKLEIKLRDSEQTLKAAIQGADLGVYDFDSNTGQINANDRWYEMLGFSEEKDKADEKFLASFINPDDRKKIYDHIKRIENGAENKIDEIIRIITKNGVNKTILVRATIVEFDSTGKSKRIIGTHLDITETVRLQKELEENQMRLDSAIRGANLGVWDLNLITNVVRYNNLYLELIGYLEEDIEYSQDFFFSTLHPDDHQLINSELNRIQSGGENSIDIIIRLKHKDGNYRIFQDRGKAVEFDKNGKIVRIIGTILDITEQYENSQKLIENEEKYRNLFNNIIDEVHLWKVLRDIDGKIINWELVDANPSALKVWGKSKEQVIGKTTEEIFDMDAFNNFLPIVEKIFDTGEPESWSKYFRPTNQNLFMTSVAYGEYFISTGRDITDQIKLQNKIQQSLEEKTILLGEIHHRVKNNLAIIGGLMDLQALESDSEKVSDIVLSMSQRIKSIAGVHELLYNTENFSDIPFKEYVNILLRNMNTTLLNKKDITLIIDIDDSVFININQAVPIGLLMNELITNSFKHAFIKEDNPIIKFNLEFKVGRYHAEYTDNGPGVNLENYQKPNSLGFTLINTLLSQLSAKYSIDNKAGFRLVFDFAPQITGAHANLSNI